MQTASSDFSLIRLIRKLDLLRNLIPYSQGSPCWSFFKGLCPLTPFLENQFYSNSITTASVSALKLSRHRCSRKIYSFWNFKNEYCSSALIKYIKIFVNPFYYISVLLNRGNKFFNNTKDSILNFTIFAVHYRNL